MPLFENTNENCISSSQGSEEFDVYPPPKRFCSGLSDFEDEINCNQNGLANMSPTWESWDCNEVAEHLGQAGLADVAEKFREQDIIGHVLPLMTREDLEKLGIQSVGKQLKVLRFIQDITQSVDRQGEGSKKVFNDPIHGHIELHPLCVKIIDTPQFQRLRFLKQLGNCYYVYPGATHNRFEHCLGVCHLAGQLTRALQRRQPELEITSKDILCCEIAGLCHDLGHGPFSHLFDGKFIPLMCPDSKWKHEDASVMMLDYLIEDNNLLWVFEEYGLTQQDITFIKEQVAGPNKVFAKHHNGDKEMWPYHGRCEKKSFLYEVVANKRNGIDVDKWDYFARDCHMLGIRNNFDHTRFIQFVRVLEVEGQLQICSRDKEVGNLYDMFHTRNTLHRRAYQHKTTNIIDTMITEAMVKSNDKIKFVGKNGELKKMSEAIDDMAALCQITDHIFFQILHSSEPELEGARNILKNVLRRKLYKCVGQTQLKNSQVLEKKELPQIKEEIQQAIDPDELESSPLEPDDIIVHLVLLDYGMKDKNPIDSVRFYMKDNPNEPIKVRKDQVSQMLPETFSEQQLRIYCKIDDARSLEMLKRAFSDWCKKRDFPPPKGGRVSALELTPLTKNENGKTTPTTAGQSTSKNTTPDSAGKFKSRLSF